MRRVLAASPALIEAQDARGRRAIHVCARRSWPAHSDESPSGLACLDVLIDAGTPFDAVQPIADDGELFPATPLWYAVAHGQNRPMARRLLDLGANPRHCLFAAVWNDDAQMLQMLLQAGAVTEVRAQGVTPLLYAARLARSATLAVLLDAGADRHARDRKGRSALALARGAHLGADWLARLQT